MPGLSYEYSDTQYSMSILQAENQIGSRQARLRKETDQLVSLLFMLYVLDRGCGLYLVGVFQGIVRSLLYI